MKNDIICDACKDKKFRVKKMTRRFLGILLRINIER